MQVTRIVIYLLTVFLLSSPIAAHAFWGIGDDRPSGLDLEAGYDTNTVTTMTGRIVSLQTGDDHRNIQLELESNGTRSIVILGPQRYWAEHGIALKAGDGVTVRGSKAQGTDGVVYILAQKITDTSNNTAVTLRNNSGRPAWAGSGSGRMNSQPAQMRQQSPGRMGGGRMGR